MAADQPVFVPDQSNHENIEDGQHYETEAVRVREAVELVDDEEAKDDKRNRIGPELISKQTDDEERLDDAVAEEIEGIEALVLTLKFCARLKSRVATKSFGSSSNSSWVNALTRLVMVLVPTRANARPPMHSISA